MDAGGRVTHGAVTEVRGAPLLEIDSEDGGIKGALTLRGPQGRMRAMLILGIESSCDETGIALYDGERGLLSHTLYSCQAIELRS